MENLNNVFIIYNEEESKEISFLEDNKEKILNNYIENGSINGRSWSFNFIKHATIKSKIMELLSNSGIKSNTNFQDIREFNNCIDFYLILVDNLKYVESENNYNLFYSETNCEVVYIRNKQYPILVFQDKNFYYLIEIYNGEFNLHLLKKENNKNIFHRLVMDMTL